MKRPYETPPESGWGSKKRVLTAQEFHERHTIEGNGCWNWTEGKLPYGYGRVVHSDPLNTPYRNTFAHRVSYLLFIGPIPEGMTVDHKCQNRECCNPDHLQLLTPSENCAKKLPPRWGIAPVVVGGVCIRGHRVAIDVAYVDGKGRLRCGLCRDQVKRAYAARVSRQQANAVAA